MFAKHGTATAGFSPMTIIVLSVKDELLSETSCDHHQSALAAATATPFTCLAKREPEPGPCAGHKRAPSPVP